MKTKKQDTICNTRKENSFIIFSVGFYIKEKGGHVFGHLMLHVEPFETLFDVKQGTT